MQELDIVIVGSGFGGLGAAVELKKRGHRSFVVLEQENDVGGVWRDNVYPNCACDIRVHLYSFSFAPNPDWSFRYARQPEIHAYLKRVADTHGIGPHVRFGHRVVEAIFDARHGRWRVRCENGAVFATRFLIASIGGLSRPSVPPIEGLERFEGPRFHSARWDHSIDFTGKTVGVIGTGASAIQFVPYLVEKARRVVVFQRTPAWIVPRLDAPISAFQKSVMRLFPSVQRVLRWWLYWTHEARLPAFLHAGWLTRLAASVAQKHLETQVTNPDLRKKLTPNYNFGCKRVLVSDDFYAAVSRPNCEIVSEGIAAVTSNGVQTQGGTLHPLDVLVFGTGFQVSDPLGTIRVVGRNGQSLSNAWASGAHAWFGTGMVGFPNFFMITGPNTGLGHNSMVFMIESQLAFVTKTIDIVQNTGAKWWEVRDDAERDFNEHLRRKLSKTVWLSGCRSWYLDERGNNIALWPGFTFAFRAGLSRFDKRVHHLEGVST